MEIICLAQQANNPSPKLIENVTKLRERETERERREREREKERERGRVRPCAVSHKGHNGGQ